MNTISASRGRSRSTPRRLCSRAPLTIRRSATLPLSVKLLRAGSRSRNRDCARRIPCYVPLPTSNRPILGPSSVSGMTVVDDNYTGHVDPGTAARRTLPGATILKASVGPMDNNAYLVTCSATGETLLIDAANDADVLIDLVRRYAPKVSLIVTSHQHFDHWQALEAVAEGHRGADRRARDRRRTAAGQTRPFAGRRRHRTHRRADVRRHPPARAHARIGRAGPRRARDRRGHAVVHRRLPVSGRCGQDVAARQISLSCSMTSPPGFSTSTRIPPSSTPATATTRGWAQNALTCANGVSEAGERRPRRTAFRTVRACLRDPGSDRTWRDKP